MKQKKPFFDFALYVDAIRRIKTTGIVTAVIIFLCAAGVPIMTLIGGIYYDSIGVIHFQQQTVSMFQANSAMPFLSYLMGPIMILQMFSFLNKRNASDFFHSIPYTRICMYVTYFLAVLTWVVGILLGACLLSGITILVLPKMSLLGSSVGYFLITEFACALLAMGITLFAASLCGTTFNSVFITVITMFAPRILLSFAKIQVSELLPFMPDEGFGFLLDGSYNLLVTRPTYILGEMFGNSFESAINAGSLSYTIILGLIYFALGALFFVRRKSEAAGKASANRGIQAVFRTFIAFLFCVPSIALIMGLMHNRENADAEEWTFSVAIIIVFYICAILAFFIYELITTKKWKNCLKAMPGLLVLLALNVVVVVGIEISVSYYSSVRPTAEQISYISIAGTEEDYYYGSGGKDYFTGITEDIKLTDENLKKIVAEQLVYSIDHWNERNDYVWYDEQNAVEQVTYTAYKVKINYRGKTIYRYVLLSENQITEVIGTLQQEQAFRDIYMNLPKEGSNNTSYYFNSSFLFYGADGEIPASGISRIVEAYQEDINDMGFEEWYSMQASNMEYDYDVMLYGSTSRGLTQYQLNLPIGVKTPKAYAVYMEECNKLAVKDKDFVVKLLRGEASSVNADSEMFEGDAYMDISGWSGGYRHTVNYMVWSVWDSQEKTDMDEETKKLLKEIGDYLDKQDDSFFTEMENVDTAIMLNAYMYQWTENDYFSKDIYLYVPCDDTISGLWDELYNHYVEQYGSDEEYYEYSD